MKNESRLTRREQEEFVPTTNSQHEGFVFPTPEEALRADRNATPLPPEITRRLATSLAEKPHPPQPGWWKRLLGLRS